MISMGCGFKPQGCQKDEEFSLRRVTYESMTVKKQDCRQPRFPYKRKLVLGHTFAVLFLPVSYVTWRELFLVRAWFVIVEKGTAPD